jgi:hypothetical protein
MVLSTLHTTLNRRESQHLSSNLAENRRFLSRVVAAVDRFS